VREERREVCAGAVEAVGAMRSCGSCGGCVGKGKRSGKGGVPFVADNRSLFWIFIRKIPEVENGQIPFS
jgi:hypothetical protein